MIPVFNCRSAISVCAICACLTRPSLLAPTRTWNVRTRSPLYRLTLRFSSASFQTRFQRRARVCWCRFSSVQFSSVQFSSDARLDAGRLWTSPELLKQEKYPPDGTLKADVYSFGIVCQEIIFREGVFYIHGMEELSAGARAHTHTHSIACSIDFWINRACDLSCWLLVTILLLLSNLLSQYWFYLLEMRFWTTVDVLKYWNYFLWCFCINL